MDRHKLNERPREGGDKPNLVSPPFIMVVVLVACILATIAQPSIDLRQAHDTQISDPFDPYDGWDRLGS